MCVSVFKLIFFYWNFNNFKNSMWFLVTTRGSIFAAKGWRRDGDYHTFQDPIPGAPRHRLVTPSEWVIEIIPLHKVVPTLLPLELVHHIGSYV